MFAAVYFLLFWLLLLGTLAREEVQVFGGRAVGSKERKLVKGGRHHVLCLYKLGVADLLLLRLGRDTGGMCSAV